MSVADPSADRAALIELVLAGLRDLIVEQGRALPADLCADTRLLGQAAALDSLGLVTLIVDLEQRIEEHYAATLTLADERAMSQQRSPFRTVGSLADYLGGLLAEARSL